jgi:hypothetical protein
VALSCAWLSTYGLLGGLLVWEMISRRLSSLGGNKCREILHRRPVRVGGPLALAHLLRRRVTDAGVGKEVKAI